jgi:hypothetical protein
LALLEDILPSLIHSLCPETTIRTFVALKEFALTKLFEMNNLKKRELLLPEEWNPVNLILFLKKFLFLKLF